jgi:hypothetical protein
MSDQNINPFGALPNHSATFGTMQKDSEGFRTARNDAERRESHTLTVREVARMFEAAGVARTERSIVNWCQPNKLGVPRLDSYFDPNERKYFISPQSAELAIKEEQAKAARGSETSESVERIPNVAERGSDTSESTTHDEDESIKTLRREVMDLKITNRAKEIHIEQLQKERERFLEKLISSSHRVGELEARLLQLEAPRNTGDDTSEEFGEPARPQ